MRLLRWVQRIMGHYHDESCQLGDQLFEQALEAQMKLNIHKRSHTCKEKCATRLRLGETADTAWRAFKEETGEDESATD